MKKVEWNFKEENLGLDINHFIEKSNKSKNLWWRGLIRFKNHFEYFKEYAEQLFNSGDPNNFPPFNSPNSAVTCPAVGKGLLDKCLIVKFPCDVLFSIDKDGNWVCNPSDPTLIGVENHHRLNYESEEDIFKNKINFKWLFPIWTLSKDNQYIFLQPQYHKKEHPFEIVNGVLEPPFTNSARELNVNTFIEIPTEQKTFNIKKDTVLAYIWFVNDFKLEYNKNLKPLKKMYFNNLLNVPPH